MYRTDFWTLWEKARVGCFKRTTWKHVYYLGWNRSPAQVGCMRQVLGPGALGRARGIGSRGRWEGGLGWGIHVNPWLIHVNVWQKPLQYCKVISLQLIKINEKKSHISSLSDYGLVCLLLYFFPEPKPRAYGIFFLFYSNYRSICKSRSQCMIQKIWQHPMWQKLDSVNFSFFISFLSSFSEKEEFSICRKL